MKKYLLLTCLYLLAIPGFSQLSVTGKHLLINRNDITGPTTVVLFDSITSDTEISYNGNASNVRFYKYENVNTLVYETSLFPPDDATGYVLEADGVKVDTFWVMSYNNYRPDFRSLEAENNPSSQCQELNILLDATIPPLTYRSLAGGTYQLLRDFKITYQTKEWNGTNWLTKDTSFNFTAPQTLFTIPAPLQNTAFTISGDQYATEMNIAPKSFTGSPYQAVAVKAILIADVTERKWYDLKNNEADAPSKQMPINYSAPIEVLFASNANEPVAQFYKWEIFKNNILLISRTDKDHRYTFQDAGTYKIKLTVSNTYCTFIDSITVNAFESAIYAPNVFTPNGDGYNDEFKVAYKSILAFDCWVYNRWGRLVYHWSDPAKGWDGTIGGRKASPGAYFYVIKATGSDDDPQRPGKKITYLLKGDINLLRGKQ